MNKILNHLANDWYKYLLELMVITAGVLGAFMLNGWNENRKERIQEEQILMAIKEEVQVNLSVLKDCLKEINEDINAADSMRSYLGPEQPKINADTLNMWMAKLGTTQHCKIVTDNLDELKSSGGLSILRNKKIKRKIGEWSSSYVDLIREENEWAQNFSDQFIPYTSKWISWDNVDYTSSADGRQLKSRFPNDPKLILQQFEFTNILNTHYWRMNRIKSRIIELDEKSEELLALINQD